MDGNRVVLKVSFIDEETRQEADALALWDGDGAVRPVGLRSRAGRSPSRADRTSTFLGDHPDRDEAISIACRLLRRLWRPVPEPHPFPSVRGLAQRWAIDLPERFRPTSHALRDRPAPNGRGLVQRIRELRGGSSPGQPRLPSLEHPGRAARALAPDRPKPLAGEPAFDTAHFLRTVVPEGLDRAVVDQLVDRLGAELDVAPEGVRAWALVRSVEDVLWGLETHGFDVEWDLECARVLAKSL